MTANPLRILAMTIGFSAAVRGADAVIAPVAHLPEARTSPTRRRRGYVWQVFGHERHSNLAGALPVAPGGAVVDLGCGDGLTLAALADCVEDSSMLVGVDAENGTFADAEPGASSLT